MSIIFVHGFWSTSSDWAGVITDLQSSYGPKLRAIDMPLTSLANDVARIEKAINTATPPVLLVGHSYGGAVITQAGNNDKVKGLVYIAGFAPDAGESLATIEGQYPLDSSMHLSVDDSGYLWIDPQHFRADFCADVPEQRAFALAATMKAPVADTFSNNITKAAWHDKQTWYAVSTEDKIIDPNAERFMAKRMGATTIEIKASHLSLLTKSKAVAELIETAAKAVGV